MARIQPVSAQGASYDGATHEVVLEASDLTNNTANNKTDFSFATPTNSASDACVFEFIGFELQTPFDGEGTLNNLSATIGTASLGQQFAGAIQLSAQHASTVNSKKLVKGDVAATGTMILSLAAVSGQKHGDYTKGKAVWRFRKKPNY